MISKSLSKLFILFIFICLSFLFAIISFSFSAQSSLDMNDYTAEMIEGEHQSLLNILGNKEGVGGPNSKNRTQILRTTVWGVSGIEKTVWDADGLIISYDIYAIKDGQLIWEHEEPNKSGKVHFMITISKDGTLQRDDLAKVTPGPTKGPTRLPTRIPTFTPTIVFTPTLGPTMPIVETPTPQLIPSTVPTVESPSAVPTFTPTPTVSLPTATVVPPTATVVPPTATVVPPTAVPSRDKIIFSSNRDGNLNIYSMNLDGSELKQLTSNPANDAYPGVSPDGRKVAFASNRDGNWEIYVMDIDGKEENAVRLTFNNTDDLYPSFTSDSKKVVFQSNRDGNIEIYMVSIDNPRVQERLTINESDDIHPRVFIFKIKN